MVFSSLIFLWIFFPIIFILTRVKYTQIQNVILLVASLFFYAWGEPRYILLMLISIGINYLFGILLESCKGKPQKSMWLIAAIILNVGLLGYYKYFNFFVGIINAVANHEIIASRDIALPIGISFYTFQAMSYVVDIYRGVTKAQKNIGKLALYISLFPQLIAGPIVQYKDIEKQIDHRTINTDQVYAGIQRFVYGLGKKVILANTYAQVADRIFEINAHELGSLICWIAMGFYMLQIYFDFSGYSDMAIGLGKMFGFEFLENFNFPYISQSIKEFWRRWHISLSSWFRDYLYIPLGGNRKGTCRTYVNLLIVFLVTGLWHGASMNFVIWGLYHGGLLVLERLFLGKYLEKNKYKFLNHSYCILMVLIGWTIFRFDHFTEGREVLAVMFSMKGSVYSILQFVNIKDILLFIVGIIFAFPLVKLPFCLSEKVKCCFECIAIFAITFISVLMLANNAYNPFIYFRF